LPKYLFNTLLKHSFEKSNFIILHSNQYHFICSNHNKGTVTADGMPTMANIVLKNTKKSTISTANGSYRFDGVPMGNYYRFLYWF
jgi:hypothetical protein